MKSVGIIPARLGSTRLPNKPLVEIDGKPMVLHVWGAACKSSLNKVVVATDSSDIVDLVHKSGGDAVMTSPDCPTGTDRVLQALNALDENYDAVLNIQGDEPLVCADDLDGLIESILVRGHKMATLATPLEEEDLDNMNSVKVLLDKDSNGIYFSRWPIPFSRNKDFQNLSVGAVMSHIGIYAFNSSFLQEFCETKSVAIEIAESLEQLRALWMGQKISVIKTNKKYQSVDTIEDLRAVEKALREG